MQNKLRIMIIEDSEDDALLIIRKIKMGGYEVQFERIETEDEMRKALDEKEWDIILSDFKLPRFNGVNALGILKTSGIDIPFIIVSGTIGEDVAVECMRAGANDYLMKNNLKRLIPAIERELRDSKIRAEHRLAEDAIKKQYSILRSIIDGTDALIFSVDKNYRYTSFNKKHSSVMKNIYGVDIKINQSLLDCITIEKDRKLARSNLDRAMSGEYLIEESYSGEESRSLKYLRISHCPIKTETGEIIGAAMLAQDMTDYKRVENAIRESEERFRQIAESIREVFWLTNVDKSKMLYISPAYEEVWKRSRKSIYQNALSWMDTVYKDDREKVLLAAKNKQAKGIYNEEYRIVRPDGEIRWIHDKAFPIKNEEGKVFRIAGVAEDITERKLSEVAILQSERRFKELANLLPQTIFESDINGTITFANNAGLKTFGYTAEDLAGGLKMLDLVSKKDNKAASENIQRVLGGLAPINNEYEMLKKDGTIFPALTFTSVIVQEGKPAGLRGTIVDISNQKQTENELRKLSEAVEQSPSSIVITDLKANIEYVNKTFSEITGYSFDEIVHKNTKILSSGYTKKSEYKRLWDTITSGNTWFGEFLNKKKNKKLYWEEAVITPIKDSTGKIINYLAVKTDITERKKVQNELELHRNHLQELVQLRTDELNEANEKLKLEIRKQKEAELKVAQALKKEKELSELKTRFISIASHEFRTPLSIIYSSSDLIFRYGKGWEQSKFEQQIDRIKKNIDRMIAIMDDVLILSRADSGKIAFETRSVDLDKLCRSMVQDITMLSNKDHQLIFDIKLKNKTYMLDENLLKLILSNLLSNAVKYSINGGEIKFNVSEEGSYIIFQIADNGIGIPEKDQFHLFDSFHRASNVGDVQGTGLGLSIVKRSVDMHGGKIEFTSKVGIGTTFTVKIPIIK